MRRIREVLRLKLLCKLSHREIARALGVSVGAVSHYGQLAEQAGLAWPEVEEFGERAMTLAYLPLGARQALAIGTSPAVALGTERAPEFATAEMPEHNTPDSGTIVIWRRGWLALSEAAPDDAT